MKVTASELGLRCSRVNMHGNSCPWCAYAMLEFPNALYLNVSSI